MRFEVTPQTIRKDLNELCDLRLLSRMHGGAIVASGVENLAYEARRHIAATRSGRSASATARADPEQLVAVHQYRHDDRGGGAGADDHEGLLVITNNLNVATLLYRHPRIEVIVAGGPVRRSDGGVIGGATVDFIRQFKVDYAVIGASAIDADGALLDYDYREVRAARAIIENARRVIWSPTR